MQGAESLEGCAVVLGCLGIGCPPPNALMVVVRGRAWALQVSAWPDACVVLALFGVGV